MMSREIGDRGGRRAPPQSTELTYDLHPAPGRARLGARLFTVFDRLVLTEIWQTLVAVLAVLVLLIVSKRFLRILASAIEGQVSSEAIFVLLGLKIAAAAIALLPSALFAAVLMSLGRMYRDSELPVFAAAGVGVLRIYRAVLQATAPLVLLGAVLALHGVPWIEAKTQEIIASEGRSQDLRVIQEGKFAESSDGQTVFYVEKFQDAASMRNIFVQNRTPGRQSVLTSATGALRDTPDGERFIVLQNGVRYEGVPGEGAFVMTGFDEFAVRIQEKAAGDSGVAGRRGAQPSALLFHSADRKDTAELQKRLAVPLGALALIGLAVPLSRLAPRGGVYGNLFAAFLIYLAYENGQRITQGLLMTGKIPPFLSYVLVYALVAATVCALLVRDLGWPWVRRCLTGKSVT